MKEVKSRDITETLGISYYYMQEKALRGYKSRG